MRNLLSLLIHLYYYIHLNLYLHFIFVSKRTKTVIQQDEIAKNHIILQGNIRKAQKHKERIHKKQQRQENRFGYIYISFILRRGNFTMVYNVCKKLKK